LTSCEYVAFPIRTLFHGVGLQLVFSTVHMYESMNAVVSTGKDPRTLILTIFSILSLF